MDSDSSCCVDGVSSLSEYRHNGSTASYAAAVGWDMFYLCEEFDPSGIQGVLKGKASGKTVHYDLNGRMIPSNAKGIHIVREADGSCRKIWVK